MVSKQRYGSDFKKNNLEKKSCIYFITNLDNQIEEEINKCLQKLDPLLVVDRDEDEKWRATIVLIWVSGEDKVNRELKIDVNDKPRYTPRPPFPPNVRHCFKI